MRGNYLAQDRADIRNAAKEAARFMKSPSAISIEMLKKIGRYLSGKPRVARRFSRRLILDS